MSALPRVEKTKKSITCILVTAVFDYCLTFSSDKDQLVIFTDKKSGIEDDGFDENLAVNTSIGIGAVIAFIAVVVIVIICCRKMQREPSSSEYFTGLCFNIGKI